MWPYGSLESPLGEQAPTYADRLDAHWMALPLQRKLHILLYLAWRLLRVIPFAIARQSRAAVEAAPFMPARVRAKATALVDEIEWLARPEQREKCWTFLRSLPTFNAMMAVAPLIAWFLLLSMFTATPAYRRMHSDPARPSVVEQARAVRDYYPPRCYYEADGDVIVMDSTWRAIRPTDPRRTRLLAQFCR